MINNAKYNELFTTEISENDTLNQKDFDVVSYINKIFPHGILSVFHNLHIYIIYTFFFLNNK